MSQGRGGFDGLTRAERQAQARRRRALAHLERRGGAAAGSEPESARQPARRPLRATAYAAVFAASLAAGSLAGALGHAGAAPQRVFVEAPPELAAHEVAAAAGLAPDSDLARLDTGALADALRGLGWVARARAAALPGGALVLRVEERRPLALVQADPLLALDAEGVAFAPLAPERYADLPRVSAPAAPQPGAADPELARAVALLEEARAADLPAPLEVGVAAPGDPEGFWLRLEGVAPRVVLGRDAPESRLAELARVLEADLPEVRGAARLDLRFRGQVVLDVSPSPAGTAQEAATRGQAEPSNRRPTG
jgi:cell division protein FtsQ